MPRFRLVAGRHAEKNAKGVLQTYKKGDVFESDSDLTRLNAPGAIKFELVGETREDAEDRAKKRGRATTPADDVVIPNAAPGGQVSSGFQGGDPKAREEEVALTDAEAPPKDQKEYHARLDKMNISQLRGHATERKINLKGETDAVKVRKIIKDSQD